MSVIMKVKTHPIEKLPAPLSEPIKKTASELAAEVKSPMVVVAFRNHHSAVKNRLIALRRALSDNQINQIQPTSTKVWPEQEKFEQNKILLCDPRLEKVKDSLVPKEKLNNKMKIVKEW